MVISAALTPPRDPRVCYAVVSRVQDAMTCAGVCKTRQAAAGREPIGPREPCQAVPVPRANQLQDSSARKVVPNAFGNGIEGVVVHPVRIALAHGSHGRNAHVAWNYDTPHLQVKSTVALPPLLEKLTVSDGPGCELEA